MNILFLIVSSIIIIACFYFIISPFFTVKAEVKDSNGTSEEDVLPIEAVYGAVNELEMDYLMKKISEEDYLGLKEQYQLLAAGIMKQGEKQKKKNTSKGDSHSDTVELEILAELQKLRKQKGR